MNQIATDDDLRALVPILRAVLRERAVLILLDNLESLLPLTGAGGTTAGPF